MFETVPLMPHAVCWAAAPHLVWTMVVTNAITFFSYVSICITLLYLVRHTRRVIARDWAWFAVGFALFIVACGSTHLMDVVTTWVPVFWIDAWTSIITALLSAIVAIMLIRRSAVIAFSINDYAGRLANTEIEKVRLTESLLAARKLEDWSRMSASVAHEINQPLEGIQNLLYLIRTSEGVTSEIVDLACRAADEADRVVTISRSTLSFFRQTNEPEPIDLQLAAESVGFLLDLQIQQKQIKFEVRTEGNLTVDAFPGETRQVLLNLVRNACDATTRPGTTISLSLTGTEDAVEIVVADQGNGIPRDVLETLFQFGNTTKGDKGNGMGLWTVRHILTKHGGDIRVETVTGEGTRFILQWPRKFAPQEQAEKVLA
jgi:signal transduction histidine kinase